MTATWCVSVENSPQPMLHFPLIFNGVSRHRFFPKQRGKHLLPLMDAKSVGEELHQSGRPQGGIVINWVSRKVADRFFLEVEATPPRGW